MRFSIVKLIFFREARDQLRDRRTLFMIFVLPILLYPLLGIGIVKFSSALDQEERAVVVIGARFLPTSPPLLNPQSNRFDPRLFDNPAESDRLAIKLPKSDEEAAWNDSAFRDRAIRAGDVDAVVSIPEDIRDRLAHDAAPQLPIYYDSAKERGQITYLRLKEVQERWKNEIVTARLKRDQKPANYTEPIRIQAVDIAPACAIGSSTRRFAPPRMLFVVTSPARTTRPAAIASCASATQ